MVPTPAIVGVAHHFGAFHNLVLHRTQGARAFRLIAKASSRPLAPVSLSLGGLNKNQILCLC